MRTREVMIDGRIYLEIIEDDPTPPNSDWDSNPDRDEEERKDQDPGVWIGQLVPYSD